KVRCDVRQCIGLLTKNDRQQQRNGCHSACLRSDSCFVVLSFARVPCSRGSLAGQMPYNKHRESMPSLAVRMLSRCWSRLHPSRTGPAKAWHPARYPPEHQKRQPDHSFESSTTTSRSMSASMAAVQRTMRLLVRGSGVTEKPGTLSR